MYYALASSGMVAPDESSGTMPAFEQASAALFAAIGDHRTLRDLALTFESASGDLACGNFEEGFRRGIAFMRAVAECPTVA
jgi:hypothetical protein